MEHAKEIIRKRFECLQKSFREKFNHELIGSSWQSCFHYPEHLEAILEWNRNATSQDDLIDLAGYNEHTIGDLGNARIVFLGNNPGSAGVFGADQQKEMEKIRQSVDFLSVGLFDTFYPLASPELMKFKPWFSRKLIKKNSFIGSLINGKVENLCRIAHLFASAELSPYHTRYFNRSELQNLSSAKNSEVDQLIKNGINKGVIFIALYVKAKNGWIERIPELAEYDNFYFCHNLPRCNPRFSQELESILTPGKSAFDEIAGKVENIFRELLVNK